MFKIRPKSYGFAKEWSQFWNLGGVCSEPHDHQTLPGKADEPPRGGAMRADTFSRFNPKVVVSLKRGATFGTLVGVCSEAHDHQTLPGTAYEPPRGGAMRAATCSRFDPKVVVSLESGATFGTLVRLFSEPNDHQKLPGTAH